MLNLKNLIVKRLSYVASDRSHTTTVTRRLGM